MFVPALSLPSVPSSSFRMLKTSLCTRLQNCHIRIFAKNHNATSHTRTCFNHSLCASCPSFDELFPFESKLLRAATDPFRVRSRAICIRLSPSHSNKDSAPRVGIVEGHPFANVCSLELLVLHRQTDEVHTVSDPAPTFSIRPIFQPTLQSTSPFNDRSPPTSTLSMRSGSSRRPLLLAFVALALTGSFCLSQTGWPAFSAFRFAADEVAIRHQTYGELATSKARTVEEMYRGKKGRWEEQVRLVS